MFEITKPIETERLILRPMEESDAEALHACQSLPEVALYMLWEPRSLEDVRHKLKEWVPSRRLEGEGTLHLAVEALGAENVIGSVSIGVTDVQARQGTFGFILHPDHQGQGYALEACRALLRLGFEELKLHRMFACCHTCNTASWKLMERLGMRREAHFREHARVKGSWDEEYHYALLEQEWSHQTAPGTAAGAR